MTLRDAAFGVNTHPQFKSKAYDCYCPQMGGYPQRMNYSKEACLIRQSNLHANTHCKSCTKGAKLDDLSSNELAAYNSHWND